LADIVWQRVKVIAPRYGACGIKGVTAFSGKKCILIYEEVFGPDRDSSISRGNDPVLDFRDAPQNPYSPEFQSWVEDHQIPEAPVILGSSAPGNVDVGDHAYAVAYKSQFGTTFLGFVADITISGSPKAVSLQIPTAPSTWVPRCIGRQIFRTKASSPTAQFWFVGEVRDNTTTIFVDNRSDAQLTRQGSPYNTYNGQNPDFGAPAPNLNPSRQRVRGSQPQRVFLSEDYGVSWREIDAFLSRYQLWFYDAFKVKEGVILIGNEGPSTFGAPGIADANEVDMWLARGEEIPENDTPPPVMRDSGVIITEPQEIRWVPKNVLNLPQDMDNIQWDTFAFGQWEPDTVSQEHVVWAVGYIRHNIAVEGTTPQEVGAVLAFIESRDGGKTWGFSGHTKNLALETDLAVSIYTTCLPNSVAMWSYNGIRYGIISLGNGSSPQLARTTDDGQSWDSPTLTGGQQILQVVANGQLHVFAMGASKLWRSTDGGGTFTEITANLPVGFASNMVRMGYDRTNGILVIGKTISGDTTPNHWVISDDNGATFTLCTVLEPPTGTSTNSGVPQALSVMNDGSWVCTVARTGALGDGEVWRGVVAALGTPQPAAAKVTCEGALAVKNDCLEDCD
jgi:hypothetical protein